MVSRFEHFSFMLSDIYRSWNRLAAKEMSKYELKGACSVYLVAMARYPEGITGAQLAELCCRDKSDVSRSVAEMVEKGFVVKVDDGAQRAYRVLLKLTDEGNIVAEKIKNKAQTVVEAVAAGVPEEQRALFYKLLENINTRLHEMSEEDFYE